MVTYLRETLQDSARMGFLHTSLARGRIPASIKAAADVHYPGHSAAGEGATRLRFKKEDLPEVRRQLKNYERMKLLTQRWIDLSMELSTLRLNKDVG